MKRCLVALGVVGLLLLGSARATAASTADAGSTLPAATTASTASATAQTPTAPSSPDKPDNARYVADPSLLEFCQAQLSTFASKPCEVIFIGDSLTTGWLGAGKALWVSLYEPRKALNFGVEGDTTQNVIWRLNNLDLADLHPKVAVVLIGKNNTSNSVHEIADGIKAVIANTQITFPNIKIILISLVPNADDHDKLLQVNSIIRSYAQEGSVYYLNLVPLMPSSTTTEPNGTLDTTIKGVGSDGVHLDATGYQIWASAMEPLMNRLLGP